VWGCIAHMTSWTYGTSKEKKGPRIPNITPSSYIQISNRVEIFQRFNPEWIRGNDTMDKGQRHRRNPAQAVA
jgi:hypothetical protein